MPVPLANDGRTVTAIEWDHDAVARLRERLPAPSSAIAGRVEEHLDRVLPADLVLLNPPRTGVDARVASLLEQVTPRPRSVIYVSCDPATLARDLGRMPGYTLASLYFLADLYSYVNQQAGHGRQHVAAHVGWCFVRH